MLRLLERLPVLLSVQSQYVRVGLPDDRIAWHRRQRAQKRERLNPKFYAFVGAEEPPGEDGGWT